MTSPSAIARFAPAPLIGLLLYWRVPLLWFQNDDFTWLSLERDMRENGLAHALFTPFAQGTVRVLGDRLFFLACSGLFGIHALPYRLLELGTWVIALTLMVLIGEELMGETLAGSRAAAPAAAVLWAANVNAVEAVAWASAYDQLLCAVCVLAAFYSRLRGRRAAEWIFYLAGFGALEITVMYPLLVVLYGLCADRRQLRGAKHSLIPPVVRAAPFALPRNSPAQRSLARPDGPEFLAVRGAEPALRGLPRNSRKTERGAKHSLIPPVVRAAPFALLFAPTVVFTAVHFLWIPKPAAGVYALSLDSRLPATFASYLAWSFEPGLSALRFRAEQLQTPEMIVGALLGLALGWFAIRRLLRREWMAAFFCGWFVVLLAPVLLLPNHLTPYYLTLPSIGLAWLAGWAIARGWSMGGWGRIAALGLAAAYFVGNAAGIEAQTRWFETRSQRLRKVVEGVAATAASHRGDAIALEGVDDELYQTGMDSHPFPLVGAERVWRVPGDISPEDLRTAVAKGHTRVLEINADGVTRDITDRGK
jgi:hypothetical protein